MSMYPSVELARLPEKQIIGIWHKQLLDETKLVTEQGEPIKVIYPGRINDDRGPDFRDGVIAIGGGLRYGDIEVHVKSSGWLSHGHHHDLAYNRVILHVVFWHDSEAAIKMQNGKSVPVLAIHKYLNGPISRSSSLARPPATLVMPCRRAVQHLTADTIAKFLDSAGEERFLIKASQFQAELTQMEASQCLYIGIMGALGYARNKHPFLELARRLPLQVLESGAQGKTSQEECLTWQQALLLGTAGLLPSQRQNWRPENELDDEWIEQLEKLWASYCQSETMSEGDWHLFRVRPNNFPPRRMAAMSYLIWRYQRKGLFEEVVNIVKESPLNRNQHRLEERLVVTTNGYWANHFDFGLGGRMNNPTLLGSQRAADIVVNVLLPFVFAWGKATSQPALSSKALDLYCRYPKSAANAIERHVSKQLGLSRLVNSARRQQGLIHIYNTLCTQGKCDCCPLG